MMNLIRTISRPAMMGAVCLGLLMTSPAVKAADPANIATAKEVLKATSATLVFNPLIAGVIEQARLLYLQQNPGLGKDLNEIAAKMRTDLQPRFAELTDAMAKMYADVFTEQEMKEILTFYQSPVGKKLLEQQPKLVDASMSFAQDWANKLSEEVIGKMREELVKRGHKM
jgi:hypothetical protein